MIIGGSTAFSTVTSPGNHKQQQQQDARKEYFLVASA
jgi:hypothetical protein